MHRSILGVVILGCVLMSARTAKAQQHRRITYDRSSVPKEEWILRLPPEVDLGGLNSSIEFHMIANVLFLNDETIALADGSSRRILLFDRNGSFRRQIGRQGSGPGEMRALWRLWKAGDRLIALDGQGHSHFFTFDGQFSGTAAAPLSPAGFRVRAQGYLANGALLGVYADPPTAPLHRGARMMTLSKYVRGNEQVLGRFPYYIAAPVNSASSEAAIVYGPAARVTVFDYGFCVGFTRAYEFTCYNEAGRALVTVIRPNIRGRSVSPADKQTFFHGIDVANPGARGADYRKQIRETTTFSDRMPAFGRIFVTSDGHVWVGEHNPADETLGTMNPSPPKPTTWDIFSLDGEWIATFRAPARFRPTDAHGGRVVGVARDDADVEHMVVYSVRRVPRAE